MPDNRPTTAAPDDDPYLWLEDIDGLPQRVKSFVPSLPLSSARQALARELLRASMPGDYLSWRGFSPNDPGCVARAETVVASPWHSTTT